VTNLPASAAGATQAKPQTAPEPGCRLCGARLHRSLIDLGCLPLAAFGRSADAMYPLHVRLCDECGLAQISEAPPGGVAACKPSKAEHAAAVDRTARYAETLRDRLHIDADSLAIEIGLNGVTVLPHFKAAGIPVFSVEAATFNIETAMQVAVQHGCADIVVAHDVLPHVPDLFDFAAGLACILKPNGVLSLQYPHLLALIQGVQFDAFRHDTYTYLSLPVTERLLRSVGLRVFDAERVPDDGGCLRVHVCHTHSARLARHGLKAVRQLEAQALAEHPNLYEDFAGRVALAREDIRSFLRDRRQANRRIVAYGASMRGKMLLNVCGLTADDVAFVVDAGSNKRSRSLPASRIPVVPMQVLERDAPDDVIILAWPEAAQIAARLQPMRQAGTQLWTLLPRIGRV
jgi:SAM-dependent methyltransferase